MRPRRHFTRQGAVAVPARDDPVGGAEREFEKLDLQDVAGPRARDRDRTGHDMRPLGVGVAGGVRGGDLDGVTQDIGRRDAELLEESNRIAALVFEDALMRDGVDDEGFARAHRQHRRPLGGRQPPPGDGRGGRSEIMIAGDRAVVRLQYAHAHGSGSLSGMPATRSISTAAPTARPLTPTQVRLGSGP